MGSAPRGSALARRALGDAKIRTITFAYLFAAVSYIQPVTYRHAYPTLADRLGFARSFAGNAAIRLFYGVPHDLLTVGGYAAWRAGGILSVFAAVYGLLGAVRSLRAEEEAGRTELVLSAPVGRGTVFAAGLTAVGLGGLGLLLAMAAGLLAAGLPIAGSAYLAIAATSTVAVFAGVGALSSQLVPTRRGAIELAVAVLAVAFGLRVVADTSGGLGALRWLTPLGWAEELRPFASPRTVVLLAPAAASALLLAGAWRIAASRDVGRGILAARDSAPPRLWLLSSPTAHALRQQLGTLLLWLAGIGAFGFILGLISPSISAAGIPSGLRRELAKLGTSVLTPTGYLGLSFIFFVLALSLFAVAQVGAARHEESGEQLETLLALPVSRGAWLGGRAALAALATAGLALVAGVLTWAGAAAAGAEVPLGRMVEAGVNCLPVALLFLGVAALSYAVVPRAGVGLCYGLVAAAFLWQLFGSLLGAPRWLVALSPFEHVGLVPAQAFRPAPAAVMLGLAGALTAVAVAAFRRRDLLGA